MTTATTSSFSRGPILSEGEQLSPSERDTLEQCERQIADGETLLRKSFTVIGAAFRIILDRRLYRESHVSFQAYCRDRWATNAPLAYNLIRSTKAVEAVSGIDPLPANMDQARHLSLIQDTETQMDAWKEVVATAPEGRVTAPHVRTVINRYLPDGWKPSRAAGKGRPTAQPPVSANGTVAQLMDALSDAREAGWKPAEAIVQRSVPDTLAALATWVQQQAALARRMRGN